MSGAGVVVGLAQIWSRARPLSQSLHQRQVWYYDWPRFGHVPTSWVNHYIQGQVRDYDWPRFGHVPTSWANHCIPWQLRYYDWPSFVYTPIYGVGEAKSLPGTGRSECCSDAMAFRFAVHVFSSRSSNGLIYKDSTESSQAVLVGWSYQDLAGWGQLHKVY